MESWDLLVILSGFSSLLTTFIVKILVGALPPSLSAIELSERNKIRFVKTVLLKKKFTNKYKKYIDFFQTSFKATAQECFLLNNV